MLCSVISHLSTNYPSLSWRGGRGNLCNTATLDDVWMWVWPCVAIGYTLVIHCRMNTRSVPTVGCEATCCVQRVTSKRTAAKSVRGRTGRHTSWHALNQNSNHWHIVNMLRLGRVYHYMTLYAGTAIFHVPAGLGLANTEFAACGWFVLFKLAWSYFWLTTTQTQKAMYS